MRNKLKKAFGLMLVFCMTASNLPYMEKAKTVHEESVVSYEESGDIVRGFGNKIKEKKQKKEKFKVNKEEKNGKAWNQRMIQAELPETSDEVIKVAIIDSGINFSTDLNVVERKNFIPDDECNILYEDATGHGTAVAGIVGALDNEEGITGVNPGVELYSARVLDTKLEAPVERIVEAIDWAIEQDVDIINMSFGIEKNVAELEAAIERAAEADILLVAASGDGDEVAYPAAYDEVIAVGSVTAAGIPAENSAGGDALELMAPGENILSSGIFGSVMGSSGTSMAAPHVVGAASVLMELKPDMSAEYIRALLNYSANLYGDSDEYGNGVIDLEYAIEINDKFQKLYEKHLKKASKDKNEKAKQKEKFWGEVLKTIPENEKAVETFTEVEVVEGMWREEEHKGVMGEEKPLALRLNISPAQMKLMTYACKYPDEPDVDYEAVTDVKKRDLLKAMSNNPYHGFLWQWKEDNIELELDDYMNSNYISNYIFLTEVACNYGNVQSTKPAYMRDNDYRRIVKDFSGRKLAGKDWNEIFKEMNADCGTNLSADSRNIQLFIYGMAIHLVTDVYAHSTFYWKRDNECRRITHNKKDWSLNADNTSMVPMRYVAAEKAANKVLWKASEGQIGTLNEFVCTNEYFDGYYLGNFSAYAKEADLAGYNRYKKLIDYGDLWNNVKEKGMNRNNINCVFGDEFEELSEVDKSSIMRKLIIGD